MSQVPIEEWIRFLNRASGKTWYFALPLVKNHDHYSSHSPEFLVCGSNADWCSLAGVGFYVLMFHITQILGIFHLQQIRLFWWCETNLNGNFRILKWRYVSTIFQAIFCGDIPLNRPYIIGLIYGKYLQWIGSEMAVENPWDIQTLGSSQNNHHFSAPSERVGHAAFAKIVELNEGLSSHAYQRISMNHHHCPIYRISFPLYTPHRKYLHLIPFLESTYYTIGHY